ncbi:MAG: hypothetical protein ABI670_05775 [Chloroflexota bacterium]
MEILFILGLLVIVALLSQIWGADSRYSVDDPEWDRRRGWAGSHR